MISSLISEFMILYERAEWKATDNVFQGDAARLLFFFFFKKLTGSFIGCFVFYPEMRKGDDGAMLKEIISTMK